MKKIMESEYTGKILRGRPRQRWYDTLKNIFKKISVLLDTGAELDREKRKSILEAVMILNGPI